MIVKRVFEPAIAQASYLIGCGATGDAIVIDPNRDIAPSLAAAEAEGLRITHVTETHIHADFASGVRELAHATGATLWLSVEGGADWQYAFAREGRPLRGGDRLAIGRIVLDVVHTPGHTPEHLSFLVTDGAAADRPIAAVTGDFLFVGDVGRPDLLERAAGVTGSMEAGARALWASLRAFDVHPDWLQIWPGHGAGSACGKGISAVPSSTLGYERRFNWAYRLTDEDAFVAAVLDGQPDPPAYFATMKRLNRQGPPLRAVTAPPRIDAERMVALAAAGALVVDTRPAAEFARAHLPGTLSLPLNGSFVTWAGWLLPYDRDLYLVADDAGATTAGEIVRQLALIGLDRVAGVSGPDAVAAAGAQVAGMASIAPAALAARRRESPWTVVDVRQPAEWDEQHLAGALHVPLGQLAARVHELPATGPLVVHCRSGARSSIAASLLERLGRRDVVNLTGGIEAWQAAGLPVEGGRASGGRDTREA